MSVDREMSERLEVKLGVSQGCPPSAWLFIVFLDVVVQETQANFHGGVRLHRYRPVLLVADDTVLITEVEGDLEHSITPKVVAVGQ